MKWIGPSTLEAIDTAASEGLGLLVTPIAFVSEHIETLVELDDEYAKHAAAVGCAHYLRAPALALNTAFIDGLATAVGAALKREGTAPDGDWRCPVAFGACPYQRAA
jgi:ferrochelatase